MGLRLAGTPIGPNDTVIAVDALMVTNTTREFKRMPGLVLEDWVK